MTPSLHLVAVALLLLATSSTIAQPGAVTPLHLADYDAELRRPDGHVDTEAMVRRLKDLGITKYYWLVWHAATDWEDLKEFLPLAAQANIETWVYLVPPSEGPPNGYPASEPFKLDYLRWAEEIARLSIQHTNLTGWVLDDFYANHQLFTPAYVRQMQTKAKEINSRLAFLPLMYFSDFTGPTAGYHFKQVTVDDAVVWEEDAAGGSNVWKTVEIDVTRWLQGKTNATLAFRLFEKKGVSNFGVHWRVKDLQPEGLQPLASLTESQRWKVDRHGPFTAGFGNPEQSGKRNFHIPFIVQSPSGRHIGLGFCGQCAQTMGREYGGRVPGATSFALSSCGKL
jgi:hypothetical protein